MLWTSRRLLPPLLIFLNYGPAQWHLLFAMAELSYHSCLSSLVLELFIHLFIPMGDHSSMRRCFNLQFQSKSFLHIKCRRKSPGRKTCCAICFFNRCYYLLHWITLHTIYVRRSAQLPNCQENNQHHVVKKHNSLPLLIERCRLQGEKVETWHKLSLSQRFGSGTHCRLFKTLNSTLYSKQTPVDFPDLVLRVSEDKLKLHRPNMDLEIFHRFSVALLMTFVLLSDVLCLPLLKRAGKF